MNRRCVLAFIAAATICPAFAGAAPCGQTAAGTATVTSIRDGRTLMLADGRELRLAGIETGNANAEGLQALAAGQTLRLEIAGTATDRYDRLVAFATLPGAQQTLQETLLEQGHALVSARVGDKACADALFAAERRGRTARRGLWAEANAALKSGDLSGLGAARGRFALVEGKVLSVRESGATIYMNFGRRWTRDFTVTVLKRQQRAFASAGLDLKKLEGRSVRVRGWIEQRGGPIIDASAPEQIEIID